MLISVVMMLVIIFRGDLPKAKKEVTPQVTSAPQQDKRAFDEVYKEVYKHDANGNYTEAANMLKQYVASKPPGQDRLKASLKLAAAYFNAKDYDNAIVWYEKIGKESTDYKYASLHGLAHSYRSKGDNQQAIAYFRQAIEFVKLNNLRSAELLIAGDEQAIIRLEEKQ